MSFRGELISPLAFGLIQALTLFGIRVWSPGKAIGQCMRSCLITYPLPAGTFESMIFLFPVWWDMLVPWRVFFGMFFSCFVCFFGAALSFQVLLGIIVSCLVIPFKNNYYYPDYSIPLNHTLYHSVFFQLSILYESI